MRGRPKGSPIRQRIVNILFFNSPLTGYDVFREYIKIYGKVSMRSIYYHLNYGSRIGEFEIHKIVEEQGDYSWGNSSQKIYYNNGSAIPEIDTLIKNYYNDDKKND